MRSSRLPLAMACPASQQEGQIRIVGPRSYPALGQAFHEVMAAYLEGEVLDNKLIAAKYDVKEKDLSIVFSQGRRLWVDSIEAFFPGPLCEVEMTMPGLTGHADVIDLVETPTGPEVRGCDWKSGWVFDRDHRHQAMGYGRLALEKYPEAETVWWTIVRVREGTSESWRWSRGELLEWWEEAQEWLADTTAYVPGVHCGYCEVASSCEARTEQLVQIAQAFDVDVQDLLGGLPSDPEKLGPLVWRLRERRKVMQKVLDVVHDFEKSAVRQHGGVLPNGQGGELYLHEIKKREIDLEEGWETVSQRVEFGALTRALGLSISGLEVACKETATPRKGPALFRKTMDALEKTGAITRNTQERLDVRDAVTAYVEVQQ